ncbi:MAG TPA: aldehyde dehydrogenase family protein [Gammaproteobacteria bacterium]|nr:aldehyde dehydrogenase family protein [Gammaproteobacteria bacterium]
MKTETIKLISPVDGVLLAERETATEDEINSTLKRAVAAQLQCKSMSVAERAVFCHKAIDYMLENQDEIAREITLQMGRPIRYTKGELRGLEERGRYMIEIAEKALSDIPIDKIPGYTRYIRREPLGVVLVLAPWNYPYLTAVNSIIPALMAGNSVILKHSAQTLLCAERFYQAFEAATSQMGRANDMFQYLHLDHAQTATLIKHHSTAYIAFTGSVEGGQSVEKAAAGLFKSVALELGGKDPAYVMADANIDYSVENLLEGAFFNSGQSCCGVERIYVHETVYDEFIEKYISGVNQYRLGNPLDEETTLGPVINLKAANYVREQIQQAVSRGAKTCIDASRFPLKNVAEKSSGFYLAPQVLVNVDHTMSVMKDETFGPLVGVMKVDSDEQAIKLMNDSVYGLTASIWTENIDRAAVLGDQLDCGTVFMNRCDYLDPALAWTGVKCSGRGCSLSALAYQQLTRPKSFHLKTEI